MKYRRPYNERQVPNFTEQEQLARSACWGQYSGKHHARVEEDSKNFWSHILPVPRAAWRAWNPATAPKSAIPWKLVRNLIHARALGAHDDHAVTQIDQGKHVTFLDPVVLPQFLGKRDDPAPDYLHFEYVVHGVSNL